MDEVYVEKFQHIQNQRHFPILVSSSPRLSGSNAISLFSELRSLHFPPISVLRDRKGPISFQCTALQSLPFLPLLSTCMHWAEERDIWSSFFFSNSGLGVSPSSALNGQVIPTLHRLNMSSKCGMHELVNCLVHQSPWLILQWNRVLLILLFLHVMMGKRTLRLLFFLT